VDLEKYYELSVFRTFSLSLLRPSQVNRDYHPGSQKKYGRILFYSFYVPKETILMTILFLSSKAVSFNAPDMCS
jgi:hypothetical protein